MNWCHICRSTVESGSVAGFLDQKIVQQVLQVLDSW